MKKILVIDDDENFRKRLARAFRARGLVAFEAENQAIAEELALREQPDYITLDLKMENESGLVVLKKLLEINQKFKIAILTGYGTINTTVTALKIGAVNYLTKPIDADSILKSFEENEAKETTKIDNINIETPTLSQVEWDHINRVIDEHDGNISKASVALGLHRRSLQRKLGKMPGKIE